MKILLIGNYKHDRQLSMFNFVNMLRRGLIHQGHDVRVIQPEPFMGCIFPSKTGPGKWLGYIDKLVLFPRILKKTKHWADVVHICDHSNALYIKYLKGLPNLLTCHDLLAIRSALGEFSENRIRWSGRVLQKMVLRGLTNTRHIVSGSESTKNDLLRVLPHNTHKISVLYYGLNHSFFPMPRKDANNRLRLLKLNPDNRFLLHVGLEKWYKNRLGALKIFRHILEVDKTSDLFMLMVGDPLSGDMLKYIEKYKFKDKVHVFPSIKHADLQALYSRAKAFLYPSLYEGFGWPLIEAQACGCPVFTSNKPPMTEICRDSAVYIDPYQPKKSALIIAESLDSLAGIKEKGLENVKNFQSKDMIQGYIKKYEEIIKHHNTERNFREETGDA